MKALHNCHVGFILNGIIKLQMLYRFRPILNGTCLYHRLTIKKVGGIFFPFTIYIYKYLLLFTLVLERETTLECLLANGLVLHNYSNDMSYNPDYNLTLMI